MNFETVRQAVEGVPIMDADQGRLIYDHVLETGATDILEMGTAFGVSAAYMAAALHELGRGKVTTLDHAGRVPTPPPEGRAFARCPELLPFVEFVRSPDSSYVWWLARTIEARSDAAGNCEPAFDFCYLDGAHDFTIDGLATYLTERLLRPDAWLLLDDLNWSYALSDEDHSAFSEDEIRTSHMRMVFDVIVKPHPSFTQFRDQDGAWGWAQKAPDKPRHYSLETSRSAQAIVIDRLKKASMNARGRVGSRSGTPGLPKLPA